MLSLTSGSGEPGGDGGGRVAGAAAAAGGDAELSEQSQAGGGGRGRAIQTGEKYRKTTLQTVRFTEPVNGLDTPSHSIIIYYFLHCRLILNASQL